MVEMAESRMFLFSQLNVNLQETVIRDPYNTPMSIFKFFSAFTASTSQVSNPFSG